MAHSAPFFSYFGSKHRGAQFLGAPVRDLVIEPFAGSACYSTYWNCRKVKLYDKYDVICAAWDFLIHSSANDILAIPDDLDPECTNDRSVIDSLTGGARAVVTYWIGYASTDIKRMSLKTYNKYKGYDCSVWGRHVKNRIIRQKPMIKNWTIQQLSYEQIPNENAHWHIDPPYNNKAGSNYVCGSADIDYADLAEWCKSREGVVQVCENEGADWLPFQNSYETLSASRNKKPSKEVVWEQGFKPMQKDLLIS